MPRITILRFTKDYETVADALTTMVKDAQVTRDTENERAIINIEGQFEHFVMEDLDMWGGYLKFKIIDNAIQDDTDREVRSILASAEPGMSEMMFSPTIAYVYKRVSYIIRTTTIVERIEDGSAKKLDEQCHTEESEPQYDWVDITREFGQKIRVDRMPAWS